MRVALGLALALEVQVGTGGAWSRGREAALGLADTATVRAASAVRGFWRGQRGPRVWRGALALSLIHI